MNVQKHAVVQVLLVKFLCQVNLQSSKTRKRPICCNIWHWYQGCGAGVGGFWMVSESDFLQHWESESDFLSDSDVQLDHFLHHTPTLGNPC